MVNCSLCLSKPAESTPSLPDGGAGGVVGGGTEGERGKAGNSWDTALQCSGFQYEIHHHLRAALGQVVGGDPIGGKGWGHEDTPWYMRRHIIANTFTTCVLYSSPLHEMAALLKWMHVFVYTH